MHLPPRSTAGVGNGRKTGENDPWFCCNNSDVAKRRPGVRLLPSRGRSRARWHPYLPCSSTPIFLRRCGAGCTPVKLDFSKKGSPRCFSKNQVSLRPATVATPGMFEGAGITDTTTRRLSIPVLEEPTCVKRMAEGGTPLRISSRRTASARSTAVFSPASLLLLVWTTKIVPLPAFRAALATMSAATGDNAELPGRKNTAALGDLACSSKDFRAIVVS